MDSRGQRHLNARVITRAGGGCALRFSHEPPPPLSPPPTGPATHRPTNQKGERGDAFFVSIVLTCRFTHTGWPGIYFRVLYIILTKGGNSLPLALRHVFDVISSNFVIEVVRIELDRRGIEKERISTVCC